MRGKRISYIIEHRQLFQTVLYNLQCILLCTCRFANPGDLIEKVEGTLLDYDTDFQLLKQA